MQAAGCTFCGLNGTAMAFRSKSAARGLDLSFFYETKANLSEAQVAALRAAGVSSIQPGIESLSTPILAHMKKGVTALQNVRLLRMAARHRIHVIWNLIYGLPGESPQEYERMASLVPALAHLTPPGLTPLMVSRFSPYHERPQEYGLELESPLPFYRELYETDSETLADLAQTFDFAHADGRDPETYIGPLRAAVERWVREAARNRGALTYRQGPGFLVITDTRSTSPAPARYSLNSAEAAVYLACEQGATRQSIERMAETQHSGHLSEPAREQLLADLVAARVLLEVDGRYLGLAIPYAL